MKPEDLFITNAMVVWLRDRKRAGLTPMIELVKRVRHENYHPLTTEFQAEVLTNYPSFCWGCFSLVGTGYLASGYQLVSCQSPACSIGAGHNNYCDFKLLFFYFDRYPKLYTKEIKTALLGYAIKKNKMLVDAPQFLYNHPSTNGEGTC